MTNMSEEEKIAWVIAASSQLRRPAMPPVELWPAILMRLSSQARTQRRPIPWVTIFIVCLLLLVGSSILFSKIASYSRVRSRAVMVPVDALRLRLDRANEISSDHDKSTALISLVEASKGDKAIVNLILMSARSIESSFEKANVLVKLGDAGAITTQPLRETYLWVANSISSKAERERALDALDRALGARPFFRRDELRVPR
jgi:hypothetical protein